MWAAMGQQGHVMEAFVDVVRIQREGSIQL